MTSVPNRPNSQEIPEVTAPMPRVSADVEASMSRDTNGPRHADADHSAPRRTQDGLPREDSLLHWDELDEQLLRMLAEDPVRGQRLRKLVDADNWLRARASDAAKRMPGPPLLVCPPADELYDFGMGPGSASLTDARRTAIDRHLATCRECEGFVASLSRRPPAPMVVDASPAPRAVGAPVSPARLTQMIAAAARGGATESSATRSTSTPPAVASAGSPATTSSTAAPTTSRPRTAIPSTLRRGPMRIAAPLAAAAAIVIAVVSLGDLSGPEPRFPEPIVLRGSDAGPVLFPRDRVLVPSDELRALFPSIGAAPMLELEPQADADSYRFEILRQEGGAFGRAVLAAPAIVATTPTVLAQGSLAEGEYVLKAFVNVRGLELPLPTRGFQMRRDAVLDARLREFASLSAHRRALAAIGLLDECGYVTDARALARTLPPSPERDRYLARPRGR